MKTMQRVFLSIMRKPMMNIIIFLVVFCAGLIFFISHFLVTTMNQINQQLSAAFGVKYSFEIHGISSNYCSDQTKNQQITNQQNEFMNLINEIVDISDLTYANYEYTVNAYVDEFVNSNMEELEFESHLNGISGISTNDFFLYQTTKARIVEGRNFTENEMNGAFVCILLNDYYYRIENGKQVPIEVGDSITIVPTVQYYDSDSKIIKLWEKGDPISLEVIGFYESDENNEEFMNTNETHLIDDIYVPLHVIKRMDEENRKLIEKQVYAPNDLKARSCIYGWGRCKPLFILDLQMDETAFGNTLELLLKKHGFDDYTILSSTMKYTDLKERVQQIERLSGVMRLLLPIMLIMILALLVNLIVRFRIKELGIYMALGQKKLEVIKQLVFEAFLVSMLALLCCYPLINRLSVKTMEGIELKSVAVSSTYDIYDPTSTQVNLSQLQKDAMQSIEWIDFFRLSTLILSIVVITVGVTSYRIVQLQPKDIL